ncbi:MAG TPA: hypothetical protein VHD60_01145 [Candidatus Saccharimonadales bacterium]|nr:hypothetical protein [Candidatus Saccharimonadales bacterium]
MIQLNLLPDVKLEYIKARRYRQLVTLIAGAVTAVSVLIMVLLLLNVKGLQAKHISDLNNDIKTTTRKLQQNTNLNKVLTIQNQLNSLPSLDAQKPLASLLVGHDKDPGFLTELTPKDASIGTLQVDFTAYTISIKGTATTLYTVNQFADTLKYTKYSVNGDASNEQKAFSDVVLSDFGYNQDGSVYYTLTCSYNPDLFDIQKAAKLDVPKNFITTRSQLDKPTVLFNGKTGSNQTTGQ